MVIRTLLYSGWLGLLDLGEVAELNWDILQ